MRVKRNELVTNVLHESDKFVSGSLVLLAPECTVVKKALFLISSSSSSASNEHDGSVSTSTDSFWKIAV